MPSVCIAPLNPLCIGIWDIEGYWITPCDLSESISWYYWLVSFDLYSANFASNSSWDRPCHPLHIPVGDLPHPHLLIFFISPDSSHYASVLREGGSGFDTAVSRPILMSWYMAAT